MHYALGGKHATGFSPEKQLVPWVRENELELDNYKLTYKFTYKIIISELELGNYNGGHPVMDMCTWLISHSVS